MKKVLACTMFAAVCAAAAFSVPFSTASADSTVTPDYSRGGYDYTMITACEFLENEVGYTLSENEIEYLEAHPDFSVKYSDKIAGRYIETSYNGDNLTISVSPYSYIAANGQTVVWVPVAVDGCEINGAYNKNVTISDPDYVTVTYRASFNISKNYVNSVINQYYNAAKKASAKLAYERAAYEVAVEQYETDSKNYSDYIAAVEKYEKDSADYLQYLADYAAWKRKDDPYQAYLAELAKYEKELEAYESYDADEAYRQYLEDVQRYQEYQVALENYQKQYKEYLDSIDTPEMALVNGQLGILSYMYIKAGNRTIRNAIMGETVTQVLSRKEELKLAGADGYAVDLASTATKNLRNIISNYESMPNDEAKYALYITLYESLTENFNELLRALDYFYRNSTIRTVIREMDREEQYCILLAQLYEICDSLNTDPVGNYEQAHSWKDPNSAYFDGNYRINGSTPAQILDGATLDYTGSPEPLENGYPDIPAPPVEPEKVDPPVFAERPQKPVPPEEVLSPGPAPAVVTEPVKPDEVSKPVQPVEYQPTEWETKLATEDGRIEYREELKDDFILTKCVDVVKYFRNYDGVYVYFYLDREAADYEYFEESINGSFVEYPSEAPGPQKHKNGYTCTFFGWEYYDGTPVDWSNLRSENGAVNVYPAFIETPNLYDVIWIIDGVRYVEKAAYGTIPEYSGGTPQKASEGYRQFRFTGWNKELIETTETPAEYVAEFEASVLITWQTDDEHFTVTSIWAGDMPEYGGTPRRSPDKLYAYTFLRWDKEVVPAKDGADVTYTAEYERSFLVSSADKKSGSEVIFANGFYTAECGNRSTVLISSLIEVAKSENSGIILRFSNYTFTFLADEVYSLSDNGVEAFEYLISQTYDGYSYSVKFGDGSGDIAAYSGSFTVTVPGTLINSKFRLYRTDTVGNREEVRFSLEGNSLSFSMRGGCVYAIYPEFYINIATSEGVEIFADCDAARRSQSVKITIGSLPVGKFVERVYVIDSEGNEIAVSSDYSFVMPASDVTVGVVCGNTRYTVIFRSDGKIISRKTYVYGETIIAPSSPVKAPDGVNSYTFEGWDSEVSTVTGNLEFNAVFSAEPLPEFTDGKLSKFMIILISAAIGVAVVVVATVIISTVFIVRKFKKRRVLRR